MTNPSQTMTKEYVLTIMVFMNTGDLDMHYTVTTNTPLEIAAAHMQMGDVARVIILDDDPETKYSKDGYHLLFDTRGDYHAAN